MQHACMAFACMQHATEGGGDFSRTQYAARGKRREWEGHIRRPRLEASLPLVQLTRPRGCTVNRLTKRARSPRAHANTAGDLPGRTGKGIGDRRQRLRHLVTRSSDGGLAMRLASRCGVGTRLRASPLVICRARALSTPAPVAQPPPPASALAAAVGVLQLPGIYLELSKAKLSGLVVLTTAAGHLMTQAPFDPALFTATLGGTFLCAASASTLNQVRCSPEWHLPSAHTRHGDGCLRWPEYPVRVDRLIGSLGPAWQVEGTVGWN
jgi:hypothetical protein